MGSVVEKIEKLGRFMSKNSKLERYKQNWKNIMATLKPKVGQCGEITKNIETYYVFLFAETEI